MPFVFIVFILAIIFVIWMFLVTFNFHTKIADFIIKNNKFKKDDVESSEKENKDNV